MMRFEKVSFNEYYIARRKIDSNITIEKMREEYENIKIPKRATTGSAGYDFFAPYTVDIAKDSVVNIPTGIRLVTDRSDIVLMLFARSGLGCKYGLRLRNGTGIVDSDYHISDNEGHIKAILQTETDIDITQGQAFMQGVIVPYIITDDDDATETRNGGFGSTTK